MATPILRKKVNLKPAAELNVKRMNKQLNIILENFPHNQKWKDDSFLGILHEKDMWDEIKYNELMKAIEDLGLKYSGDDIPRRIAWPITRIFSHAMMLIQAHYDKNDGYKIKNLSADQLFEFREDFQLSIEKFFSNGNPREY